MHVIELRPHAGLQRQDGHHGGAQQGFGDARKTRTCAPTTRFAVSCISPAAATPTVIDGSIKRLSKASQHPGPPLRVVPQAAVAECTSRRVGEHQLGELGFREWSQGGFQAEYRFTSHSPLGTGQYGVVYRGEHVATGRQVAVKVISKDRDDCVREQHLLTVQTEVALLQSLQSCSHVVRMEGVYEDEHCVYLVQQLCTGGDLRTVVQRGRLSEKEAAQVMRSVLEVIHTCHAQHHLYGDCKPANFLLLHPHRIAGCKEFPSHQTPPTPPAHGTLRDFHQSHGALSCSNDDRDPAPAQHMSHPAGATRFPAPHPGSHTDTIRRHLQASFQLPAAQSSWDTAAEAASGRDSLSPVPECDVAHGVCESGGGGGGVTSGSDSQGARKGEEREQPGWLRVLATAQPVPAKLMAKWAKSGAGQQALAANGTVAGMRGTWLARCSTRCYEDMVVLATDFGCSQPLHAAHTRGTIHSKRIGSPVYMAPEMWQASGLVGPAVDVWAAGVMLYQLLSGQYPFWSMSPDEIDNGGMQLYQVVCGIQSNPVRWNADPWDGISRQCRSLIEAMLDRQPSSRISARAALRHPWFSKQLGYTPVPSAHTDPLNDSLDGALDEL